MATEAPVLAQNLKKLVVPGKVSVVLWTRRSDSYTLQVVLPRQSLLGVRAASAPSFPRIQAWLLTAEGTHIQPVRQWESPENSNCSLRCLGSEILYAFPSSVGTQAVAAVIQVDDRPYLEALQPFADATAPAAP